MPEHAIVGQFLEWRTGEVGCIPHQQQVRKIVGAQLLNCVFGDGQGFVIGLECAAFVHRADLDSNPLCINLASGPPRPLRKENASDFPGSRRIRPYAGWWWR